MDEIALAPLPPTAFDDIIGDERARRFARRLAAARDDLDGHTIWHVNSTAQGGGVAEMLQSILGYLVGAEIRCRWLVIDGDDDFFALTKQLHHLLHGKCGDGNGLPAAAREIYEQALADDIGQALDLVAADDIVVLNDPQTLGIAPALKNAGARLVFTSHIGADEANANTQAGWQFLAPYVEQTDWQVFSRQQYAWPDLDPDRVAVIPPCLDPFSPKNQVLDESVVLSILATAGMMSDGIEVQPAFRRQDRSDGLVDLTAEMLQESTVPADATVVTQVSRWDPLKDHAGVMRGFLDVVPGDSDARLVLAGPSPDSVTDDPESKQVLDELRRQWEALPPTDRGRVHIACLPMDDTEQNAAVVNALQRRSDVIVQKSLAEGFGLTVAEAMWKGRATVGSQVGGIQDQIEDGRTGLLLDNPRDLAAMGRAVATLAAAPHERDRIGVAAHRSVVERYLPPEHLSRYLELVTSN